MIDVSNLIQVGFGIVALVMIITIVAVGINSTSGKNNNKSGAKNDNNSTTNNSNNNSNS